MFKLSGIESTLSLNELVTQDYLLIVLIPKYKYLIFNTFYLKRSNH